jgi:hypothetical protein
MKEMLLLLLNLMSLVQLHHKMSNTKMRLSVRCHDNQDNDRQYNDTQRSLLLLINIMSLVANFNSTRVILK